MAGRVNEEAEKRKNTMAKKRKEETVWYRKYSITAHAHVRLRACLDFLMIRMLFPLASAVRCSVVLAGAMLLSLIYIFDTFCPDFNSISYDSNEYMMRSRVAAFWLALVWVDAKCYGTSPPRHSATGYQKCHRQFLLLVANSLLHITVRSHNH